MKAIFASDLHGNRHAYDRLFTTARDEGIKVVILGGDLTPKWPILRFRDGAIVPLVPSLFCRDENRQTYTEFLRKLAPLVRFGEKAVDHFLALGGYELHGHDFIAWEDLVEDQQVLRLMLDQGLGAVAQGSASAPLLNEGQWVALSCMLEDASKKVPSIDAPIDAILADLRERTLGMNQKKAIQLLRIRLDEALKGLETDAQADPLVQQYFEYLSTDLRRVLKPYAELTAGRIKVNAFDSLLKTAANEHPLAKWIDQVHSNLNLALDGQTTFLEEWLAERIRAFQAEVPGAQVYGILGNDDLTECTRSMDRLQSEGLLISLSQRVVELEDGTSLGGYPYVPSADGYYAGWHKSENDIEKDLVALENEAGDPSRTIFVVHCPPGPSALDWAHRGAHYGSTGVAAWLAHGPKRVVLSGHIHEAPFLNGGVWRETIHDTPCFQPGAWHDKGLCAIVFETDDPQDARWIHNPT